MADLYLERIGFVNPTIVKRDNNGKIERLESRGLDMASLVAFWRRCFDLDGLLFEKITLHCKSKDFNAMGGRTLATVRSVRELLAEQGVECVIDDEWFKGKEENDYKQKLIATEERYDTLTKTSVEALEKKNEKLKESQAEIEILKLQNKKLAEAFDSLDKKYDSLKLELELAQACHKEKCAEFNKLCFDYAKLQVRNEKFEQNMKNVLEIEKKNAVKEFAEKLKAIISEKGTLVRDYTGDELVLRREIDVDEALESIDELFEEVFGNDEE